MGDCLPSHAPIYSRPYRNRRISYAHVACTRARQDGTRHSIATQSRHRSRHFGTRSFNKNKNLFTSTSFTPDPRYIYRCSKKTYTHNYFDKRKGLMGSQPCKICDVFFSLVFAVQRAVLSDLSTIRNLAHRSLLLHTRGHEVGSGVARLLGCRAAGHCGGTEKGVSKCHVRERKGKH